MARRAKGTISLEKDGRWIARLTTGYNANGNPKRVTRKCRKDKNTKVQAEMLLSELIQEHDKGTLTDSNRVKLNEWLDTWLDSKTGIEASTRRKYQYELRPIRETIGHHKLQKLKPIHIRQAYIDMSRKNFSHYAQGKAKTLLNAALRLAVIDEVIVRNPADGIPIEKPSESTKKKAQAWTPTEVQAFLDGAKGHRLYNAFYLMLTIGLRRGEVLGLKWEDIDLIGGTVRISRSYSITVNKAVMKSVKTESSKRTIFLSTDLIMMFETMSETNKIGLVFPSSVGTPIYPRNLNREFDKLIKGMDADLRKIRIHDLRHTYATLALQHKIPVEVVSERLGHSRVSITLDTYRHLYEPERREAAVSLTDMLGNTTRIVN